MRQAIRDAHLLSIPAVMRLLEWRTPDGCASCRPALNYYLISTWPHEGVDDPQSRYINERALANIQKDGSFSVMPRMWAAPRARTNCGASPTSSTAIAFRR